MEFPIAFFVVFTVSCTLHLSHGMNSPCQIGSFQNGSTCQLCPRGSYQNATGAVSCIPCPAGSYNSVEGAQGLDTCRLCPHSTFSDRVGASSVRSCTSCPVGTNSPPGSSTCISCPANSIITLCGRGGSVFPGGCRTGFHAPLRPHNIQCSSCSDDEVSEPNAVECENILCPNSTFIEARMCKTCLPGSRFPIANACSNNRCFRREVFDRVTGDCMNCPPGFQGNRPFGAVRCVPCPFGTFKGRFEFRCLQCPVGQNTFVRGGSVCKPDHTTCQSNFFRSNPGACMRCTRLQRYDSLLNECVSCGVNELSEGGVSTDCRRCPRGSIPVEETCLCDAGWEITAAGNCRRCRPGHARRSTGSLVVFRDPFCDKCPKGHFAPRAGMSDCLPCPEGTWQPLEGKRRCTRPRCPRGLVPNFETQLCVNPATNCPPNFVRDVSETTGLLSRCDPLMCPNGTFFEEVDFRFFRRNQCSVCSDSTRFNPVENRCVPCLENEIGNRDVSTTCRRCPRGTSFQFAVRGSGCSCGIDEERANRSCVPCSLGMFRTLDMPGRCVRCPAGTILVSGFRRCRQCPVGSFSSSGSLACQDCPVGTTTFETGSASCVPIIPSR